MIGNTTNAVTKQRKPETHSDGSSTNETISIRIEPTWKLGSVLACQVFYNDLTKRLKRVWKEDISRKCSQSEGKPGLLSAQALRTSATGILFIQTLLSAPNPDDPWAEVTQLLRDTKDFCDVTES